MKNRISYLMFGLSALLFMISAIFFSRYLILHAKVESAAAFSYRSVIVESQSYQKELEAYIQSGKKLDTENLAVYVANIKSAFENYGLIINTINGVEKPLYQERNSLFIQLWREVLVDYNSLSLDKLKSIEKKTDSLIKSFQKLER